MSSRAKKKIANVVRICNFYLIQSRFRIIECFSFGGPVFLESETQNIFWQIDTYFAIHSGFQNVALPKIHSLVQRDWGCIAIFRPPPPPNYLPWFTLKRTPCVEDDNKALDLPSEITFRFNAHNDMLVSRHRSEHYGFSVLLNEPCFVLGIFKWT